MDTHDRTSPSAGWYEYGTGGHKARWDAHAWTGASQTADDVPEPAPWHHRPFAFLGHRWFWTMVVGWALFLAAAYVVGATNNKNLAFLTIPGGVIFMAGVYFLVDPHVRFAQLPKTGTLLAWGLAAGVVANLVAHNVEKWVVEQSSFFDVLWLAGPIEETSKLLVPFILLVVGGTMFRDPRAGLFLVLVSGMTFGAWEATFYVGMGGEWEALGNGFGRPLAELLHPFLTAFAAGVIWLAAWRRGRAFTWAGLVAYAIAMAIHSVHDGGEALLSGDKTVATTDTPITQIGEAISTGLNGWYIDLLIAVLLYLLLRHAARELVPPNAVAENAPHWRPALRLWGVPSTQRAQLADSAPAGGNENATV